MPLFFFFLAFSRSLSLSLSPSHALTPVPTQIPHSLPFPTARQLFKHHLVTALAVPHHPLLSTRPCQHSTIPDFPTKTISGESANLVVVLFFLPGGLFFPCFVDDGVYVCVCVSFVHARSHEGTPRTHARVRPLSKEEPWGQGGKALKRHLMKTITSQISPPPEREKFVLEEERGGQV